MNTGQTPAAIVGLELDGRGFEGANSQLTKHAEGWEKISQTVARTSGVIDSMATRVATIGGAAGLGVLINDLVRLEDQASRAALAVGRIGGHSDAVPFRNSIRGAAVATSQNSSELGAAINALTARVGTRGMGPSAVGGLGLTLGNFSNAYSVDLGTTAASAAQLDLFTRNGPQATQQLLAVLANQAARSGMEGQTAQFLEAVTGGVGLVGSMHPGHVGRDTSRQIGALYGAVASVNPIFKDPGLFAGGVAGIDNAITNAYRNPRLEASLQMAGIDYEMQRGGLAGPHGAAMAKKLLRFSQRQYGEGTTAQFVRSQIFEQFERR